MRFSKIILCLVSLLLLAQLAYAQTPFVKSPAGTTEQIITHTGYVTSYNKSTLTPNWVCWILTAERVQSQAASREDADDGFLPDPQVRGASADTHDYTRSGYDRGHMSPAADNKFSVQAMRESFYLSNVCPQNPTLNSDTWCDLEKRCRYWAYKYEPIYIACGPIFPKSAKTIGQNGVAVPTAFFKVVCRYYKGKPETLGFVIPNESHSDPYVNYSCSVEDIEALTGFTFFTHLPADVRRVVIQNVNSKYWN